MTRRPQADLEQALHYVYVHLDHMGSVIYAGRTANPDSRPESTQRRPWVASESAEVRVSPPMTFEAAIWAEAALIQGARPKHNRRRGQWRPEDRDWRIDRYVEVEGVTRTVARAMVTHLPTDPEQFEALLGHSKTRSA